MRAAIKDALPSAPIGAPSRIVRARSALARAQARWIVGIEPWRGLGYSAPPLGRWLARAAREQEVWIARPAPPKARRGVAGNANVAADIEGILVIETPFLLGGFIALLAVRPAAARRGIGRALVERARRQIFSARGRRWLYVSADSANRVALAFYRKLGFVRVGRLPDLIRAGRTEILLRQSGRDS
jgi:ribosomal protein S18 acetylase RimI-like enzyme